MTRSEVFPTHLVPDETGLVGWGADLSEAVLLEAYAKGIFPWSGEPPIPWYSPDPRLILVPGEFHVARSLRKFARRTDYEVVFDRGYRDIMRACAKTERPGQNGTWISQSMIDAYGGLFDKGIGHCVGVWRDGRLVGGLYGLSLGKAFFGESMFSAQPNASKLALGRLCQALHARGYAFVDCQQNTEHLATLGARPVSRRDYLQRLEQAVAQPGHDESWQTWGEGLPPLGTVASD